VPELPAPPAFEELAGLPAAPPLARPGNRVLVAVLSALVVGLLALTAWLGFDVRDRKATPAIETSREGALAAGRDAARLIFSYDYRRLAKDFKAAEALTTGEFRKEYANTTKKLVSDVAPRYKAVLLAEVSEVGVVRASEDRVELLTFLNVQSTSTLATNPKITPRRLTMTMERVDGRWLVAKIDAF